jgi:hypothetical protein
MTGNHTPRLFILGGLSGILGTLSYVVAIAVPLDATLTYLLAMSWPLFSIIFIFSLYQFVAIEKEGTANRLAFIFGCLAFALVAVMMSAQLAVKIGMQEYIQATPQPDRDLLRQMEHPIRLVDMGIDVAWDLFIGTSLIFLSAALKGHPAFRTWWAVAAALLGIMLITLNVITFPWPPNTRGLFDVGPAVGLYIIILSTRLVVLGARIKSSSSGQARSDQ